MEGGREGEYGRSWGECKGNWDVREDTRATLSQSVELFSVVSVTSSTQQCVPVPTVDSVMIMLLLNISLVALLWK